MSSLLRWLAGNNPHKRRYALAVALFFAAFLLALLLKLPRTHYTPGHVPVLALFFLSVACSAWSRR
jgi:hypothetical protein